MLTMREVLLAKAEVTYNVDPTPTGSDAVLVEKLKWAWANVRLHERAPVKPTLAPMKPIYGGALMEVSFEVNLIGSGAAGTAPEYAPILRACGIAETVVPATSVTYKPDSSPPHDSVTLYYYQDGVLHKVTGCRGKASFNCAIGAPGKIAFTLLGHYAGQTDTALATPTYDAVVPVPFIGVPFTVDSYGAVISKLALDPGIAVTPPDSVTATDGYGEIIITGRKPVGSFDPLAVLKATKDFLGQWQSGAALALTTGTVGSSAGNRWALSAPAITYTEAGKGDRGGITAYEMAFMCAESSGDDEWSLVLT